MVGMEDLRRERGGMGQGALELNMLQMLQMLQMLKLWRTL